MPRPLAPRPRRARRLWLLATALLVLATILGAPLAWLAAKIQDGFLERTLSSRLSELLGRRVTIGAIRLGWTGGLHLERIGIAGKSDEPPLFLMSEARAEYTYWKLFTGDLRIDAVRFIRPSLNLIRLPDGRLNFADVLEKLAGHKKAAEPPRTVHVASDSPPTQVPDIPLQEISFDEVSILLEDRTVSPAVVHELRDLDIILQVPGPTRALGVKIDGRLGTAKLRLRGELYVAPLHGRIELAVGGLSLQGLEPYLERLPVKLQEPALDLSLSAWAEMSDRFLRMEDGKPELRFDELRYGGKLRLERLEVGLPGGRVSARASADLVKDGLKLQELSLDVGDSRLLEVRGSLEKFLEPSFDLTIKLPRVDLAGVLALVPPERLPAPIRQRLAELKPTGELTGELRALGTVRQPLVSGWLAIPGVSLVTPAGGARLSLEKLRFDAGSLDLTGLHAEALGGSLDLDFHADRPLGAPAFRVSLAAKGPRFEELPFPLPVAGLEGRLALRLTAAADLARIMKLNGAGTLRELAALERVRGFEPLLAIGRELRAELERVREVVGTASVERFRKTPPEGSRRPADRVDWQALETFRERLDPWSLERLLFHELPARLAGARELLGARLDLGVRLEGLEALVAGRTLGVEGELLADIDRGVTTRGLRVSFGGIPLGIDLALDDPLERPVLRAGLVLAPGPGKLSLESLAALAPSTARTRLESAAVDLTATVGLGVSGRLSAEGPRFAAELFAEGLAAGKPPLRVRVPSISVRLDENGLAVPRTRFQAGPANLELEVSATRSEGAQLLLRTAPGEGVRIEEVLELVPEERREKLRELARGAEVGLEVKGSASLEDASASLRLRARHPIAELGGSARARDLFGTGDLDGVVQVSVPRLESVRELLPPTVAERLQRLDLTGASLSLRTTFAGDFQRLELGGAAVYPGGETAMRGTVSPLGPSAKVGLSLATRLHRMEEIVAMLPAEMREKIARLRPEAEARLRLNVDHEPGLTTVEQLAELATARATITTRGVTIPVDLSGTRGAVRAVLRPGEKPELDVDLSGLRGRTVVRDVPIEVSSQGSFHVRTTLASTSDVALRVNGDPVRVDVLVGDPFGERRTEASVRLDAWPLGTWAARFIPKERSVVLTGSITVGANAMGRPPFLDGYAYLELANVHVDAPELRGLGAGAPLIRVRALRDDVVIDDLELEFGARRFHLPLKGSIKKVLGVDNVYKADPKTVGPKILDAIGGPNKIKALIGEKQIERLIIDQTVKIIVWLEARDHDGMYVFKNVLPPEDVQLFLRDPQAVADKHIELAKQALAEKMGFPKRTYGEKNYRMINIRYAKARMLDAQLNSIWPEFIPFWRLTTTPSEW